MSLFTKWMVKSVIVRMNWLTDELKELNDLRIWKKCNTCYICSSLIDVGMCVGCVNCTNTICSSTNHDMFECEVTGDPYCDECITKDCINCLNAGNHKYRNLISCSNTSNSCDLKTCRECTYVEKCVCGFTYRYCSEDCMSSAAIHKNLDVCYQCDDAICPHMENIHTCEYELCSAKFCKKCHEKRGHAPLCYIHMRVEKDELLNLYNRLNVSSDSETEV